MIGVGGSASSAASLRAFIDETGVGEFPHIADLGNDVWERYEVRGQPRFVFINDDGTTQTTRELGEAGLIEQINQLIES